MVPNRLSRKNYQPMVDAMHNSIIAFAMGRASDDHYATIAAGVFIADEIATIVQRHRHLREELKPALKALATIYDRQAQRTVSDSFWSATPDEVDALELAFGIYRALMVATPGPTIKRATTRTKKRTIQEIER